MLTKGELERWSAIIAKAKVYEKSNYRGFEKHGHSIKDELSRTKEQWNNYCLQAPVTCQVDWKQVPYVLFGKIGQVLQFGIFLKETKTEACVPYSVRIFGVDEKVVYWSWSKYQIFRLLSERAQAALSYYIEQALYSHKPIETALNSLLGWIKSHESFQRELRFDMERNTFLPPCVRSFREPLQSPPRYPIRCVSSKHRKLNSFIGTNS